MSAAPRSSMLDLRCAPWLAALVALAASTLRPSAAVGQAPRSAPMVQLVALRIPSAMPRGGVLHAIRRDAWSSVWQCAIAAPQLRGSLRVRLHRAALGSRAEWVEPISTSHRVAGICVLDALKRVHLPPLESEPAAGASVEFELIVRGRRMPGPLLLVPPVASRTDDGVRGDELAGRGAVSARARRPSQPA